MEQNSLKPQESLKIIEEMIQRTKAKIHDSSFYFLFWGWVILSLSVAQSLIDHLTDYPHPYIVWSLVIVGVIVNIIYGSRHKAREKYLTHIDKVNIFIWISFMISYAIVIVFMNKVNYQLPPLIFLLAGNATFLTGLMIKFRPIIIGGIIFWISTIALFILPESYAEIISPVTLILGYLVPGYMLKYQKKKSDA